MNEVCRISDTHMNEVCRIFDTHMNELWHLPPTPKEMERAASISITNESCYAHTYERVMAQTHITEVKGHGKSGLHTL